MRYYTKDPKRDHNFDNHPHTFRFRGSNGRKCADAGPGPSCKVEVKGPPPSPPPPKKRGPPPLPAPPQKRTQPRASKPRSQSPKRLASQPVRSTCPRRSRWNKQTQNLQPQTLNPTWLFLKPQGPFCGRPYHKSPTIWCLGPDFRKLPSPKAEPPSRAPRASKNPESRNTP